MVDTWVCVLIISMPSFIFLKYFIKNSKFGIISVFWMLSFILWWAVSEQRGREENLSSDVFFRPERWTRPPVPELRSSAVFLTSLQSRCCLPLPGPCPLPIFSLYIWEFSCILQFATAPVALRSGRSRNSISTGMCHCSWVNFAFSKTQCVIKQNLSSVLSNRRVVGVFNIDLRK